MKKRTILLFSIVWSLCVYTQSHKDLLFLKESLLKRDYLFHNIGKSDFKKIITKELRSDSLLNKWKLQSILSQFKEPNLLVINDELKSLVRLKSVYHKLLVTSISKNNAFLLENEVLAINN
ncbi:MAG TPA: hypothetical protein ENK67_00710, partial [Flavobacteriia bacterium]|nr:hypothetical protein [Flavobacteriia bacterium]